VSVDHNQSIAHAKAAIDNGFSRVGPGLKADNPVDRALTGAAGRMIRLGNSVALLIKQRHAEECMPLLRSMAGLALAMRWAASSKADEKEVSLLECSDCDFWALLKQEVWRESWKKSGITQDDIDFFRIHLSLDKWLYGPAGLPWSHVFHFQDTAPSETDEVSKIAARAMGHALAALDARWPGSFQRLEDLWS
jgi:hypothetical protein